MGQYPNLFCIIDPTLTWRSIAALLISHTWCWLGTVLRTFWFCAPDATWHGIGDHIDIVNLMWCGMVSCISVISPTSLFFTDLTVSQTLGFAGSLVENPLFFPSLSLQANLTYFFFFVLSFDTGPYGFRFGTCSARLLRISGFWTLHFFIAGNANSMGREIARHHLM